MPFFQKPPIQFRVELPQAFRFFAKYRIGHSPECPMFFADFTIPQRILRKIEEGLCIEFRRLYTL